MGRQVSAINIKRLWYGDCLTEPPSYYKVVKATTSPAHKAGEILYADANRVTAITNSRGLTIPINGSLSSTALHLRKGDVVTLSVSGGGVPISSVYWNDADNNDSDSTNGTFTVEKSSNNVRFNHDYEDDLGDIPTATLTIKITPKNGKNTDYASLSQIMALPEYETKLKGNIEECLDGSAMQSITDNLMEIANVHQDTWSIEESEPSQESYRNQLTGMVYRRGTKTMGEVTFNFTIGRYDFESKAALMGGTATSKFWKRSKGAISVVKTMVALTEDDIYCMLPYADIAAREANTDGAIGIAVTATAMEPENDDISSEYWIDALL